MVWWRRRQIDAVVALVCTGGSNSEFARALGRSESTVKKHLEGVFRVLQVMRRAAAALRLRVLTVLGPGSSRDEWR
jgi:DNA-binding CsgD family transcriptional regulator